MCSQVSSQYDAEADRLLLRVRSSDDKVFAVWMTRRLCLRLWPHQLQLSISDAHKRNVQLVLGAAVRELMVMALRQADWGFGVEAAAPATEPGARILN